MIIVDKTGHLSGLCFLWLLVYMTAHYCQPCSGLTCKHIDICEDTHGNCSKQEEDRVCNSSDEYCFTITYGDDNRTWLHPAAVLTIAKGCADGMHRIAECFRPYSLCHNQLCRECCEGDGCNAIDPRTTPTTPSRVPANPTTTPPATPWRPSERGHGSHLSSSLLILTASSILSTTLSWHW